MFNLESSWKGFSELMAHRERSGNTLLLLSPNKRSGLLIQREPTRMGQWEVGDKKCTVGALREQAGGNEGVARLSGQERGLCEGPGGRVEGGSWGAKSERRGQETAHGVAGHLGFAARVGTVLR